DAAFDYRPCAGGLDLATFQQRLHAGMVLELLEGLERFEFRVLVIQARHEAHVHPVLIQVIEEAAAVSLGIQGPADAVLDQARLHAAGWDAPEFLQPYAISLGRAVPIELEFLDEALAHAAAAAFRQHRDARMDVRAGGEVGARRAVFLQAHVAAAHADDLAALDERDRGAEAGEYVHPQAFRLGGEPGAEGAQGDDEVAAVVHLRRRGQSLAAGLGQQYELILGGGHADGRRVLAPIRQQPVHGDGVHDAAGEDVGAHLGALLQDADGLLGSQLLQADGEREACRPCTDDDKIVRHDIALDLHIVLLVPAETRSPRDRGLPWMLFYPALGPRLPLFNGLSRPGPI